MKTIDRFNLRAMLFAFISFICVTSFNLTAYSEESPKDIPVFINTEEYTNGLHRKMTFSLKNGTKSEAFSLPKYVYLGSLTVREEDHKTQMLLDKLEKLRYGKSKIKVVTEASDYLVIEKWHRPRSVFYQTTAIPFKKVGTEHIPLTRMSKSFKFVIGAYRNKDHEKNAFFRGKINFNKSTKMFLNGAPVEGPAYIIDIDTNKRYLKE